MTKEKEQLSHHAQKRTFRLLPLRARCAEDLYPDPHNAETLARLDSVSIQECGEPLVDLRVACPDIVFASDELYLLRAGAAQRLTLAQERLNAATPGCRIRVGDAFRSSEKQARFYRIACMAVRVLRPYWSRSLIREAAARFVASPFANTPAPHLTGGAVDVRIVNAERNPIWMGPRHVGFQRFDCPELDAGARSNRDLLRIAMESGGFSNYPEEWWHWSYGDSGWALRTGAECAIYGAASQGAHQTNLP